MPKGKGKKKSAKGPPPAPRSKKKRSELRQGNQKSKTTMARGPVLGHHVMACSILDPFCVHARGAKHPDGSLATISLPLKGVVPLTGYSTSGGLKYTFIPNPVRCQMTWSQGAGLTWNSPVGLTPSPFFNSLLDTYAKEIRITSFGVVVRCIMTATTAKGSVLATVETAQPSLGMSNTAPGTLWGETTVTALGANTEFSFVSKPQTGATLFKPYSAYTSATATECDWTCLTVEVPFDGDKGDGIPMLSAEIYMNVEFTLASVSSTGTGLAQMVKPAPLPNPRAIQAARVVQTQAPSIIDGAKEVASDYLSKFAMKALTSAGELAMTLL
jgi:hypothetical protein